MSQSLSFWSRMILLWIASCSVKILLQPAYHSTDALVHRHWKAVTSCTAEITCTLPAAEWYFDDSHVHTRHTLDYPPAFALFESFWSNVLPPQRLWPYVVGRLLVSNHKHHDANDNNDHEWTRQCLQLFPSDDVSVQDNSSNNSTAAMMTDVEFLQAYPACKAYLRVTVMLSDVVFWWGAWQVAASSTIGSSGSRSPWTTFLLLVWHPAFLWLDHVHFQYNGFLLGIWMLSLVCLLKGRRLSLTQQEDGDENAALLYHLYHSVAAVLFALLLTCKHLYLPLSLWYLTYLLRYYCCTRSGRFLWRRLAWMGVITLTTLVIPFLPILWTNASANSQFHSRQERLVRIFQRLFPFDRGLVHDYWAGNWWAFYVAAEKVLRKVRLGKLVPVVSPTRAALVLLVSVIPGAVWGAWRAATPTTSTDDTAFWSSLTYTALASFATAYHGHEKAILTTLVPLTVGFCGRAGGDALVWRTHAFALLSLLPLLYPAAETLTKIVSMVLYLAILYQAIVVAPVSTTATQLTRRRRSDANAWDAFLTYFTGVMVTTVTVLLEVIPMSAWRRFTFVPLAITSLVSATGLSVLSFGQVALVLRQDMAVRQSRGVPTVIVFREKEN